MSKTGPNGNGSGFKNGWAGDADITTKAELTAWLANAEPGTGITYHVGNLVQAREEQTEGAPSPRALELNSVADELLEASDNKRVCLTQRRIGADKFEYRAEKKEIVIRL
jgi:hypothetical protein